MIREQTEERLRLAIEKFKEDYRLNKEAREIVRELGADMCRDPYTDWSYCYEPDACERLQVYTGVRKLAEALGAELRNPRDLIGRENETELGFVFDRVLFFQLVDSQADETYTFRQE